MARKIKQLTRIRMATGTITGTATVQAYGWTIPATPPTDLGSFTFGIGGTSDLRTLYSNIPGASSYLFNLDSLTPASTGVTLSTAGLLSIGPTVPINSYTMLVDLFESITDTGGITNATTVVPLHTAPKPDLTETLTDNTAFSATYRANSPFSFNGTHFKRVTQAGVPGLNSASLYFWTYYSQLSAWNSTGTLMMVGHNGRPALYEYVGGEYVLRRGDMVNTIPGGEGWKWSPTEPYNFYYTSRAHNVTGVTWPVGVTPHANAVLCKGTINPTTWATTTEVVGSFPQYYTLSKNPSYEAIRVEPATGHLWVGCVGSVNNSPDGPFYAFVYNITTGAQSPHLDLAPAAAAWNAANPGSPPITAREPDGVTLSPKADKILIQWGAGTGRWFGFESFNRSTFAFIKQVEPTIGHYDVIIGLDNVQYIVYFDSNAGIYKANIDSATPNDVTQLLSRTANLGWTFGIHVSAQHGQINPSNFVVISADDVSFPNAPFVQEVFLVYLDSTAGTPHVLRLCQSVNSTQGSALATINKAGTQIAFGSDWRTTSGLEGDVFVVDIPSDA